MQHVAHTSQQPVETFEENPLKTETVERSLAEILGNSAKKRAACPRGPQRVNALTYDKVFQ